MVKIVLLSLAALLLLALAAVLLVAARRPNNFRVARAALVQAPPERVFPLINDMRRFNGWNPYNHKDPAMTGHYDGPPAGPGAHYEFASRKAGTGYIEITQAMPPAEVRMRLFMTAPFPCDNVINFNLLPRGGATEVTWAMQGKSPFIARVVGVVFNMDKMVGRDFEQGLASLKSLAEQPAS